MSTDRHTAKVAAIVAQLRADGGQTLRSLRKRGVPHQVPKARDLRRQDGKVDIGSLTEVLSIDPVRRRCTAESGVTFVDLVRQTLEYGLVPIVVPELATITLGGAVSGCSLESMSFARGGFHDTCSEYEVITASGEVLTCRRDNEHQLVFGMMHGSFGTLGILSKLVFELVPAKPFVHVVYETYPTLSAYQAAIRRRFEARDVDFMDGMIHSPTCHVLCLGRFVDAAPYTHRYDWTRVYYRSTRTRREDYLRTMDYFFRYDRGVTNVHPKSWIGRLLFGKLMTSTRLLAAGELFHRLLPEARPPVTVDLFLPFSKIPDFMAWYDRVFAHYPLWCVPYRRVDDYPWLADAFWQRVDDPLFLDLAIYGMRQRGEVNAYRLLEEKVQELGGIKTLISHNYYTPEEFWSLYNRRNYDAVKRRTDPHDRFRDLYDKTCRAAMGHG